MSMNKRADKVKDVARDAERAVRHGAEGLGDEIEERTGVSVNRRSFRITLYVVAAVVIAALIGSCIGS